MKIIFICGSIEPQRNGVGDYTRCLAGELIRRGHEAFIVSLYDVVNINESVQNDGITDIPVLRIHYNEGRRNKIKKAKTFINKGDPDFLSLQFVPYAFDFKGLPLGLSSLLEEIGSGYRWHVMMHELWLGLQKGVGIKKQLIGAVQKQLIKNLFIKLNPFMVHTHVEAYEMALALLGFGQVQRFPLFGNIRLIENVDDFKIAEKYKFSDGMLKSREECIIAGVFGEVHPEWNPIVVIEKLLLLVKEQDKLLVIEFVGKSRLTKKVVERWNEQSPEGCLFICHGEKDKSEVSAWLQSLNFGLSTTPWGLQGKSGSVVAMREHGLNVVVARTDWELCEGRSINESDNGVGLFKLTDVNSSNFNFISTRQLPKSRLPIVADSFLSALSLK